MPFTKIKSLIASLADRGAHFSHTNLIHETHAKLGPRSTLTIELNSGRMLAKVVKGHLTTRLDKLAAYLKRHGSTFYHSVRGKGPGYTVIISVGPRGPGEDIHPQDARLLKETHNYLHGLIQAAVGQKLWPRKLPERPLRRRYPPAHRRRT